MKSFDIEKKQINQVEHFEKFVLFLMDYLESNFLKELFCFVCFGDEICIESFIFDDFLDLFSPSFIVEKSMFRIYIDMNCFVVWDFLKSFENLIETVIFEEEEFHGFRKRRWS